MSENLVENNNEKREKLDAEIYVQNNLITSTVNIVIYIFIVFFFLNTHTLMIKHNTGVALKTICIDI